MQGIHLFTFKGIPVAFHPSFLILIFILSVSMGDFSSCIIFGICAVLGVIIHELGHAMVARHYHLAPQILLQGLGGITTHSKSANDKQDFFITLAGPMAGLVVGGIFLGLYILSMFHPTYGKVLDTFPLIGKLIYYTASINLVWGIFNLIPIIPMDGSKILNFIFRKFCKQQRAAKISAVLSVILLVGVAVWSILTHNMWMIMLSAIFLFVNYNALRSVFRGGKSESGLPQASLAAEKAYERGLLAAREHDWKNLEIYGNQMKRNTSDPEQLGRAYEFLTIAATNQHKYKEALKYAEHARQSDAVLQATARCHAHLSLPE